MHLRLLLSVLLLAATPALAVDPVVTAFMLPASPTPKITVRQELNGLGQLRYAAIVEDNMLLPVEVVGLCKNNWRIQQAVVSECATEGTSGPSPTLGTFEHCPEGANQFHHALPVDQQEKLLSKVELIEAPTESLDDIVTEVGEVHVTWFSGITGMAPAAVRAETFTLPVDWPLEFTFTCRRWAGNNDWFRKTTSKYIPLEVTFLGVSGASPPFTPQPDPPGAPVVPIPFGELTDRTRIEQATLLIAGEVSQDPCEFALSGSFVTSGPTEIVYRIVDDHGAKSPEFSVNVDQSLTAFVSHTVSFTETSGAPLGLEAPVGTPAPSPGALAFPGTLAQVPSDRVRGFFRLEMRQPHGGATNIVSYNLDSCEGGIAPSASLFEAVIPTHPKDVADLFEKSGTYRHSK